MQELIRFAGVCLLAVLLSLCLKGTNPVGSLMVLLGAVLLLSLWNIGSLQNIWISLEQLTNWNASYQELYFPVIKVIGISATVQIAGALCKDAGASALASQLEIVGTSAALLVCFPLFEQILEIADALLD